MKNSVLVFLFLSGVSVVFAQSVPAPPKISYFNSFHAGGLFGKKANGSGESFATIHGVRMNKYAFGIGVGYDAYHEWRTLPVFASLSYDFLPLRDNTFFIQLNGGYARAWSPMEEQSQFNYEDKRGPCAHALLGYRIHSNKFNLYLTAGYKLQEIQYEQTFDWWSGPGSKVYVARDMERVSVQLGFGFR